MDSSSNLSEPHQGGYDWRRLVPLHGSLVTAALADPAHHAGGLSGACRGEGSNSFFLTVELRLPLLLSPRSSRRQCPVHLVGLDSGIEAIYI